MQNPLSRNPNTVLDLIREPLQNAELKKDITSMNASVKPLAFLEPPGVIEFFSLMLNFWYVYNECYYVQEIDTSLLGKDRFWTRWLEFSLLKMSQTIFLGQFDLLNY